MANIYTRNLHITNGPWRIQNRHRGIIYDQQDRKICVVPKAGTVPLEERLANLAAIAATPELLAALREAAALLEGLGVKLNPEFYELMRRATPNDEPVDQNPSNIYVEPLSEFQRDLYGSGDISQVQDPD
jgi:hypothetical protein